ncbi:MAG: sugar transferase [Gemmatimonadetes bacterium]|nr:sugar transferase [Gemmatimonadota bacterium]
MAVSLRLERGQPKSKAAEAERTSSIIQWLDGFARRALNVFAAVTGLVLLSPLMLVIAILIKLTSRGPVLYRQVRIGIDRRSPGRIGTNTRRHFDYGGTPFTIYKFRTMQVDTAARVEQTWARPDDARITPVGRILRRVRLDELPQLFNVLQGDMNVVGPRPEQPNILLNLRGRIGRYQQRQRVLPGITGLAQINLCYDRTLADVRRKVALDLQYISRQSTIEDLWIMLQTVPVMLGRKRGW